MSKQAKQIYLTKRDRALLESLLTLQHATKDQLQRLSELDPRFSFSGKWDSTSSGYLQKRLKALVDAGLATAKRVLYRESLTQYYYLKRKGALTLGVKPTNRGEPYLLPLAPTTAEHSLLCNDVLIFALTSAGRVGLEVPAWYPENQLILRPPEGRSYRPDGTVIYQGENEPMAVFLEIDRTSQDTKRIKQKIEIYREIGSLPSVTEHQVKRFRVVFVCESQVRAQRLFDMAEKWGRGDRLLFGTLADVEACDFFTGFIWAVPTKGSGRAFLS